MRAWRCCEVRARREHADEQHADDGQRADAGSARRASGERRRGGALLMSAAHGRERRAARNAADSPRSSSMRSSWLYLATRSERAGAPVLIWPQLVATARSAIVVSSVSPERCDITAV